MKRPCSYPERLRGLVLQGWVCYCCVCGASDSRSRQMRLPADACLGGSSNRDLGSRFGFGFHFEVHGTYNCAYKPLISPLSALGFGGLGL